MSKPIKLTIRDAGLPLPGAEVVIGEYAQRGLITDQNGEVNATVADNFCIFAASAVRVDGVMRASNGPRIFEAGGEYTINLPAIEEE